MRTLRGMYWGTSLVRGVATGAILMACAAVAQHTAVTPAPQTDDWWQQRHAAVNERAQQGDVELILIGDSITHGWDWAGAPVWERHFASRKAVNMGFSGDRTQHALWRLQNGNIDRIRPKAAILMIGTNNHADNTAEEIADGVKAIVSLLRERLPETRLLLLAIFPRADVDEAFRKKLEEASTLFSALAADPMVDFLDINTVFLDANGHLSETVMPNRLHPNLRGYELWAHAMEPTVARLLGEEGASPLFNGKDLSGWEQVGGGAQTWGVEDGVLYTDGEGGGWLATTRMFADFELELEFKMPPGGNSGVFVRAPRQGNPAFDGLEIQLLDDAAPQYAELKPDQYCGGVYALIAPAARATKRADEWQHMRIRYLGTKIEVVLNGVEIVRSDIAEFRDRAPEHPGVLRATGYIGLQNHGSRCDFRNIRIRELEAATVID